MKNISTSIRSLILTLLFIIAFCETQAQMVYLPDTNFRNKLVNLGYGSCIVGDSIDSSCPLVTNSTSLNVSYFNIHDLQGIQAFGNLTYLDCSYDSLANLPALPNSLIMLICNSNQLNNLPSLPDSLSNLTCDRNQLTSLPVLPSSLITLSCYSNQLTSLPVLPNSLVQLGCTMNQLTTLPPLPLSLSILHCENNQLSELPYPSLSNSLLSELYCSYNQITWIPILPNSLLTLRCNDNQLTDLPDLPDSLTTLYCDDNQITFLPNLPSQLSILICSNNNLINLPSLPNSLIALTCSYNQITNLPTLPITLYGLSCAANFLTNLSALPNSLQKLDCSYNQLVDLPPLPNTINEIWCDGNLLTSLPELPDSLYRLVCYYNPITCLPQLKRIYDLRFYNTNVTCLPNYGNITLCNPPLNSLPLCGLFNPNGCNIFYNIAGKSYFDSNINCLFDASDVPQHNLHLMLYKNGNLIQQTFSGGEGYYSFDVNDSIGNYTIKLDTSNIPFTVLCPANINYNDTITATDSIFYDNDFALKCKTGFDVGAWSILGFPFRPSHNTTVHIQAGDIANFYGAHCASGISGTVTISFTGSVSYISPAAGALTPSSVAGNTVTYNIADFGAVDLFTAFNIIVHTDTFAVVGSQVCFNVSVLPTLGDNNIVNNTLTHCFTVVNSFDPNEKEVSPISDVDVNGDRWLTYTINFQNTGTAPAEHIYIDDTLSSNFDLSTFQLLAYSYQPIVQILEGGIARFNFPNINLPDSNTNEPASHGYVQYKIKLKDGLLVNTQISNTAYIYFDFNTPVVTNTTSNTLIATGISSMENNNSHLKVYPNPSTSIFHFQFSDSREQIKRISITDITGREIYSVEKNLNELNTSELSSGIYFYSVFTKSDKLFKGKLIKE